MYWSDVLDYARSVIIFEGMENSRTALPMTDENGMRQFRKAQDSQINFIWSTMFPRSAAYSKEQEEMREEFKRKRPMYKALEDKINKERGTYREPLKE